MASKVLLALSLSLLLSYALAETCSTPQLSEQQQCRFDQINAAQPSQRIQSEGGVTELWDENEDQFQCAGVAPMRNVLSPNGLSLPNYHPTPRLVFIERGQGFLGITFPGCPETYHTLREQSMTQGSQQQQGRQEGKQHGKQQGQGQEQQDEQGVDLHQKVHRIRRGDIIALPAGAAHWCYNDGNEELVAVSINDLNHQANQLDQNFRAFYLAGGIPRSQQQQQSQEQQQGSQNKFQNILQAMDPQLLAEAYNVPQELVEQIQNPQQERGLSVIVKEPMRFTKSDQEEEEWQQCRGQTENNLAESFCSMKIKTNLDRTEPDFYTKGAGKLVIADRNKLPILKHMDMSAERGHLYQNALFNPSWHHQGHTIIYVTRGDGQVTTVNENGETLMNNKVNQGDMYVIPQFHLSNVQAGNDGFEWVAFLTTGWPMGSSVAGYTSVIRAMPLQVISHAYQISPNQAQALKMSRGAQSLLLSPSRMQSQRQV